MSGAPACLSAKLAGPHSECRSLFLDDFLLDRLFQPAVDGLARVASCFGLARVALVLAAEAQGLTLLWLAQRDRGLVDVLCVGAIVLLTLVGAQQSWKLIGRAEREARRGTMNARRVTLRSQRVTWLVACTWCSAILLPQMTLWGAFEVLACAAWVCLIYFVSCSPAPPPVRRALRAMAGAH